MKLKSNFPTFPISIGTLSQLVCHQSRLSYSPSYSFYVNKTNYLLFFCQFNLNESAFILSFEKLIEAKYFIGVNENLFA
ncbi:MAG: hypothetical protein HUU44_00030 [Ignavibacteriaceae bacterium]|nr:hypothetical protein [Ignavibacteriaceae bacterium]